MRTVRGTTGLLLDVNSDESRNDFAASINRVLNALAHVDDMGYCQGQNYVVDVMMKAGLPERETFCLFLYLLRQGHFHGMYRKEVAMLAGYMDKLEEKLKDRLPELSAHFEGEQYPPPLYALEWITTFFGLAAQPLVSLVALDLFLAGARNPVLRLCVSLLGEMEGDLLGLDQEGLLKGFRSRALNVDAEGVIVRALADGGKDRSRNGAAATTTSTTAEAKRSKVGDTADRALGWSTGPDYLLVLRCRNSQTLGLVELREEAKNDLLSENSSLQVWSYNRHSQHRNLGQIYGMQFCACFRDGWSVWGRVSFGSKVVSCKNARGSTKRCFCIGLCLKASETRYIFRCFAPCPDPLLLLRESFTSRTPFWRSLDLWAGGSCKPAG